jgi:hypothetical protein
METKKTLEEQMQEVVSESMKGIIGDNAKDEVRKLLKESEDEDSFSEEEVTDDTATTDKDETTEVDDVTTDTTSDDGEDVTTDTVDVETTEDGEPEDAVDDDVWDELEKCKSADGEFDCRGMDDGHLLKVLKAMGPEDGIRVMKNDDGTIAVEVDGDLIQGEEEFVIDVDDLAEPEDAIEESRNNECNESNTGYTSDYQKKTAMTTPDNHEPANPKTTYSMDGGVPTGTEKPFANQGDKAPYDENVNEEYEFEVETDDEQVNEVASTTENNPTVRGTGMTHANTNSKGKKFRSSSEGGQRVKGTGENTYSGGETNESLDFKRKMNKLYEENKQMKSIIPELQKKLMESMVINSSMGYIVRLLNENTTSVDEKKEISARFSKVNTLDESKQLYQTISEELKKVNKGNNVNGIFNSQLAESKQSKQSLVETTMYKSEKVNEALDFMKRLDNIK